MSVEAGREAVEQINAVGAVVVSLAMAAGRRSGEPFAPFGTTNKGVDESCLNRWAWWLRMVVDRGQRWLVIAAEAGLATPYYGGVALARARGLRANLLTVSGGGHTALVRSPFVAEHMILYLVEPRIPGGHAC